MLEHFMAFKAEARELEVAGGVDISQLAGLAAWGVNEPGAQGFGKLLEGKLRAGDLAFDDGQGGFAPKDAGEPRKLAVTHKYGAVFCAQRGDCEFEQLGREEWHVAREEEQGGGAGGLEGGVDAADGAAAGHEVAADDTDRHGEWFDAGANPGE